MQSKSANETGQTPSIIIVNYIYLANSLLFIFVSLKLKFSQKPIIPGLWQVLDESRGVFTTFVHNICLGKASKKNVKFGLLAELRRGRGLRGVHGPNLLSGIYFIVEK